MSSIKHIVVSERQRGNPLLEHIRNVPWRYATAPQTPDYVLGDRNCALFISVRYHLLKPQYPSRAHILWRIAATPRPRRGYSSGESRRRRGRDVDMSLMNRGDAAAATWIFL